MACDHEAAIPKSLRRADLARATGCNLETIRYYEGIGLLPPPARTAAGHRTYDAVDVQRLRFIMRARDLGFTLEETRDLLALVDGGFQTCGEVQAIAARHLDSIAAKIADLKRIQRVLSETVAQCSGEGTPECAVIDALTEDA